MKSARHAARLSVLDSAKRRKKERKKAAGVYGTKFQEKGETKMPTALQVVQKFFPEVTEVEDAKRNSIIEVTTRDEKTANKKSHKTCAMAVACKRKFALDGVV